MSVAAVPLEDKGLLARDAHAYESPAALPEWLGVRLQQLVALETVVSTGSFSRAASALGYSQSAISQQVAALENAAGGRLLERTNHLQPTPAGAIVLRRGRAIQRELVSLAAELAALDAQSELTCRIVTHHPTATRFLREVLAGPDVVRSGANVLAHVAPSYAAAVAAVERGGAELAFLVGPTMPSGELRFEPLFAIPLRLVVAVRGGRPAPVDTVRHGDLAGQRLLCVNGCPATGRLLEDLTASGVPYAGTVRADDEETLVRLVRAGLGSALLPADAGIDVQDVACLELERCYSIGVSVAWSDGRPLGATATSVITRARRLRARLR